MFSFRPHILITNDDGVYAPGIRHLWNALKDFAALTVVAPAFEQSAMGLSTTLRDPLRLQQVIWDSESEKDVWSVTGTPADCVKIALSAVLNKHPDLVVSGINRGSNMGRSILYSGTVAAAIESTMQGIPAIAFSCQDFDNPDYEGTGKYVPYLVNHILSHPLPNGSLLNVNFPSKLCGKIKGFKMTPQGNDWWAEDLDERIHPTEGHSYYWLGAKLVTDEEKNGDGVWLRQGYITAVPVQVGDLTDHQHIENKAKTFENCFPQLI